MATPTATSGLVNRSARHAFPPEVIPEPLASVGLSCAPLPTSDQASGSACCLPLRTHGVFLVSSTSDDDIVFEDFARQRLKGMKDDKDEEEDGTGSPHLNNR